MNCFQLPVALSSGNLLRPFGLLFFVILLWRSASWRAKKHQRMLDELDRDVSDDDPYWTEHDDEPQREKR